MKPKKQFKPQDLRTILVLLFFIVISGGAAVTYYGLGVLRDYATQVNQRLVDADASGKQIEELQVLKSQLVQSNSLVAKANQLFATPDTYRSQTLADIKNYADAAGLSISSTTFDDTNSQTVSVVLSSPVSYAKLITFLSNIESNLPKLQVVSLSLSRDDSSGPDGVKVSDIKIDTSVR